MRRIILKISGEALSDGNKNISIEKVNNIAKEIKALHDLNVVDIGIICGAGNIWRGRDAMENGMDRTNADYMGMLGTILNCMALQNSLEKLGLQTRVLTSLSIPQIAEPYIRRKADSHMNKGIICIFGGGTGNPYFSTDTAAALRATEVGAEIILFGKTVDGVYDSDPDTNPNAKKYETITYSEILSNNLQVIDSTAASLCRDNKMPMAIFELAKSENIIKVLCGENPGTIVNE